MNSQLLTAFLITMIWFLSSQYAVAEDNDNLIRRATWNVEIKATSHSLKIDDITRPDPSGENETAEITGLAKSVSDSTELNGTSTAVQLGGGYLAESWIAAGSVDFILGPHKPVDDTKLNVDFVGTGFSFRGAYFPFRQNLRSPKGAVGIMLGLSYADIIGRAVGSSQLAVESADDSSVSEKVNGYLIQINDFSGLFGLVYTALKKPRPVGNSPELLKTRIEGYIFTFGIAQPLITDYNASYEKSQGDQAIPERLYGSLKGRSLIASISTLLGV